MKKTTSYAIPRRNLTRAGSHFCAQPKQRACKQEQSAQAAAKKEVRLARVEGIRFTQHYYLVWHRDKYRNPAMEEFIRMVRESGNEMNINE